MKHAPVSGRCVIVRTRRAKTSRAAKLKLSSFNRWKERRLPRTSRRSGVVYWDLDAFIGYTAFNFARSSSASPIS
jgi:hypothetical protein